MRPETGGEYIIKHEEVQDEEKVSEARENLSVPLGTVEYADSGREKIENFPFVLEFSYQSLPENAGLVRVGSNGKQIPANNFRLITDFQITRTDKNITLGLVDILPPEYEVYICPWRTDDEWNSTCYTTNRRLVIGGDITKPEYILHLLHEAGHAQISDFGGSDQHFMPEENWRKVASQSSEAAKLLNERDADAFALKRFRAFLDKNKTDNFTILKNDFLTLMHQWALESYSSAAKSSASLNQEMQHYAMDWWDDFANDENGDENENG
jgi:hypothetical protein